MYYYPVSAVLTECLILSVVEQQDSYGYEISLGDGELQIGNSSFNRIRKVANTDCEYPTDQNQKSKKDVAESFTEGIFQAKNSRVFFSEMY